MMKRGKDGGTGHVADAANDILKAKYDKEEVDPLELDDNDEALIKSIKFGKRQQQESKPIISISRLTDAEEEEMQKRREVEQALIENQQMELVAKVKAQQGRQRQGNPLIKVKRKRKVQEKEVVKKVKSVHPKEKQTTSSGDANALGLLAGYGSDSDSD
eukprot:CAMPEP_0197249658 /NCGR_PEP_ID=MMETSP1429-20130617/48505_1 /TAXON_ID=49237 /ORGANISM="Chaetoceros  sp., Strain UNC1202" /LENGTH=158 /DNA_ID=CAMNT_0042711255 /DNA_START=1 /DNA_END=477 /DNA_ORIENTATION=-